MATYTSYLNLEKPTTSETFNLLKMNQNWDKIDAGVSALNSKLMNDKIINRDTATVHDFIFPNQSANIIAVNGNGGSRQYIAYVYNSTNSLTIFELGKGNGITVSNNESTLSLTFNSGMACAARIINVSGSNNVT